MSEEKLAKLILEQIVEVAEGVASTLRAGDDTIDSRIAGAFESFANGFDIEWIQDRIGNIRRH